MFFATGGISPIALTAAIVVFSAFGDAQATEQHERNLNHGALVVVQAQTPSNTCAHERSECLRARAQKGIYGSQYVPPDDAARCNEAYRACLSGGGLRQPQGAQPVTRPLTVDFNGAWGSNIGFDYQITQTGNSFRWVVVRGTQNETGNGTLNGNKVSASWSGTAGSGSASGFVVVVGHQIKIEWTNGVIFLKR